MKRYILTVILCAAAVFNAAAAISLTATKVKIEDQTVDKANFYLTVTANSGTGDYTLYIDLWPQKHSLIGSFTYEDGSFYYNNSKIYKSREGETALNWTYLCQVESKNTLSIVSNGDGTCTLSGYMQAERGGVMYSYTINPFVFDYSEEGDVPEPDPFRFEPTTATTINFTADVVHFRERDDYIEVTLNEMANATYDWIELRLLSDTMDMPAGTYTIDASGKEGSLTASKGYLGSVKGDDPSYVAIRGDKDNWGQYTPYYLESGSLTVSFNDKGDTITVSGEAKSHNGTTVKIYAHGYNMLYVVEEEPREPENKTLGINQVAITYISNRSDSANNKYRYTFDFSQDEDYPSVLVDVILAKPMELVAGSYTLGDKTLSGLQLSQNQNDFEMNMFYGSAYNFTQATLTLAPENDSWRYTMEMHDDIGSEYRFSFTQQPQITLYPQPQPDAKDQPYMDEQQTKATISIVTDSIVWKDETVSKDGILDILLTQKNADVNGLRAYIHLGMYTDVSYPAAGTYPVNGSEESGTFSASLGRYGNVLIPCYVMLMDEEGWARAVWYIVSGNITISYDENQQPVLFGEGTTYFGSTVKFADAAAIEEIEGVEEVRSETVGTVRCEKILRDGQVIIVLGGKEYNVFGTRVK